MTTGSIHVHGVPRNAKLTDTLRASVVVAVCEPPRNRPLTKSDRSVRAPAVEHVDGDRDAEDGGRRDPAISQARGRSRPPISAIVNRT
jgi:hypothetical protein